MNNNHTGWIETDTIAAIATSIGEAGISIVRMSGPEAFSIADLIFEPGNHRPYSDHDNRRLRYGWITDGDEILDEVLVSYMRAPHTYTTEDVVEINAHGGSIAAHRILSLLLKKGVRLAERGEFTKRAFLNGRLDLSQAEAIHDIIDAQTDLQQAQAMKQLSGSVTNQMHSLKEKMLSLLSDVEYSINFMEDSMEDLPIEPMQEACSGIIEEIHSLLLQSNRGRLIREGILTVIAGRPNVGKSSLLNSLLAADRAIVTDIPGTTRDAIEESYNLDGVPLRLIDTAGIRETEDIVERFGVDRSHQYLQEADLVLILIDGSQAPSQEDFQVIEEAKEKPCLVLLNKEDLGISSEAIRFQNQVSEQFPNFSWIQLSVQNKKGIERLKKKISQMIFGEDEITAQDVTISNIRQLHLLEKTEQSLESAMNGFRTSVPLDGIEVDLRDAYRFLAEITGESIEEDVLDRIFQNFCVGK